MSPRSGAAACPVPIPGESPPAVLAEHDEARLFIEIAALPGDGRRFLDERLDLGPRARISQHRFGQ